MAWQAEHLLPEAAEARSLEGEVVAPYSEEMEGQAELR